MKKRNAGGEAQTHTAGNNLPGIFFFSHEIQKYDQKCENTNVFFAQFRYGTLHPIHGWYMIKNLLRNIQ